jgi:hypothetical protein
MLPIVVGCLMIVLTVNITSATAQNRSYACVADDTIKCQGPLYVASGGFKAGDEWVYYYCHPTDLQMAQRTCPSLGRGIAINYRRVYQDSGGGCGIAVVQVWCYSGVVIKRR